VASFHGTSTKANDKNESQVLDRQFTHLGRQPGNACPAVFQKYLTGHPKGAAAAWMLNGVIQILNTGIIPGNRNADNVDAAMRRFEYILYPSRNIHTDGIKAGLLKSFGFGQVGGEALVLAPEYVLGVLTETQYEKYRLKCLKRRDLAYRYWHDAMTGVASLVKVKHSPPYTEEQEPLVYLNPCARTEYDSSTKSFHFKRVDGQPQTLADDPIALTRLLQSMGDSSRGVGVDVELIHNVNIANDTFIQRNFTSAESAYCQSRPDPRASYAGRWSAKEAVFKAISSLAPDHVALKSRGAAAPLIEAEILSGESGAPVVVLHGWLLRQAQDIGVKEIKISISHAGSYAVAMAMAMAG